MGTDTQRLPDRLLDLFGEVTLALMQGADEDTPEGRRVFASKVADAHTLMSSAVGDPVALTSTAERFEALLAELRAGHDVNVAAFLGVAPARDE